MNKKDQHYFRNGKVAWEIIEDVLDFHEGGISNKQAGILYNIMKYVLRYPYKGNPADDLRKVKVYIDRLIEVLDD